MSAPSARSLADLLHGLAGVGHVLLVALAIATAHDRHVDRVAERTVERRRVLRGVGEDRGGVEAGVVERLADGEDLAVHHPRRRHDVGPRTGLGDGDPLVELERGVVVGLTVVVEHTAVAVVGVLVDAEIRDQHQVVAVVVAQVAQCQLDDAVGVPGLRPLGVLRGGDPEQDHGGDAEGLQLGDVGPQRRPGVLDLARQGADRLGLVDVLADEQGRDEVVGVEPRLPHHPAQRLGAAQAAEAALGEGHPAEATDRDRPRPRRVGRGTGHRR